MGFFGEIIDSENTFETDIPVGYTLTVTQAVVDPAVATNKKTSMLRVDTVNQEHSTILCILNQSSGVVQVALNHEFGPEDSPVRFFMDETSAGSIHLSGTWKWDESQPDPDSGCGHDHGEDSDCEDDDEDEDDDEEDDEEESEEEEEAAPVVPDNKKRTRDEKASKESTTQKTSKKEVKEAAAEQPKEKKAKTAAVEPAPVVNMDAKPAGNQRKKWRVKPQNEEGILVLEPKVLMKPSGVTITDYVIGKGAEPKPGAKVKVTYEGMYPDGTVFDSNLKRTKPFTFRKGTGQVIKGLDKGIEGMKVGGAREIIIPSELGYGSEGIGEIPGNQTLVFRVTLIGQNK